MDVVWLVVWWLAWLALAVLYQPLAARALGRLPGGGWAFARMLGLGVGGYLCWLAASLELSAFTRASALAAQSHRRQAGPGPARRGCWRERWIVSRASLRSGGGEPLPQACHFQGLSQTAFDFSLNGRTVSAR